MIWVQGCDGGGMNALQRDIAGALAVCGENGVRSEAIGMSSQQVAAKFGRDMADAAVPEQVNEYGERVGTSWLRLENAANMRDGAVGQAGSELIAGHGDAAGAVVIFFFDLARLPGWV